MNLNCTGGGAPPKCEVLDAVGTLNRTLVEGDAEEGVGSPWTLTPTQTALSCSLMVALGSVALAANLGIVYYEKIVPDNRRTLLNKVAALASLYKLCMATMFPVVLVRLAMDRGLSDAVCRLHNFAFMFSLVQLLLSYDELVVLHYIYICKLGAVGIIKEEIVLRLVIWINLGLGCFLGLAHGMTLHLPGHVYHTFCTNTRILPVGDDGQQLVMFRLIFNGMFATTFVTHCAFGWKIWKKKKSLSRVGTGGGGGGGGGVCGSLRRPKVFLVLCHPPQAKKTASSPNLHASMLDDLSSVFFFAVLFVLLPPLAYLLFLGGLPQAVTLRLVMVAFLVVIMPLSVYVRKPHVRTTLVREVKASFNCS